MFRSGHHHLSGLCTGCASIVARHSKVRFTAGVKLDRPCIRCLQSNEVVASMWLEEVFSTSGREEFVAVDRAQRRLRTWHSTGFHSTLDLHTKVENSGRPSRQRFVSLSLLSMNSSFDSIETTFSEKEFCQWLVANGYTENESTARHYCQDLVDRKLIVCVNRIQTDERTEPDASWFAFAK